MIVKESTVKRWAQEAFDHMTEHHDKPPLRQRNRPRPNSRKKRRARYWFLLSYVACVEGGRF